MHTGEPRYAQNRKDITLFFPPFLKGGVLRQKKRATLRSPRPSKPGNLIATSTTHKKKSRASKRACIFFPDYDALSEDPPISYIFRDEATQVAKEWGIPDVGYFGVSMSTGPIFSVESAEALMELRKAMAGKYKIVVKKDLDEYYPTTSASPQEAKRFIKRQREQ